MVKGIPIIKIVLFFFSEAVHLEILDRKPPFKMLGYDSKESSLLFPVDRAIGVYFLDISDKSS